MSIKRSVRDTDQLKRVFKKNLISIRDKCIKGGRWFGKGVSAKGW